MGIAVFKIKLDNYIFNRARIYKTISIILLVIYDCSGRSSVKANLSKVNIIVINEIKLISL